MAALIAVQFALAALAPALVRVLGRRAYLLLALGPLVAFVWLVAQAPTVLAGGSVVESLPWIPALAIELSFRMGTLQWVLALLVSGVGALILAYCRWYFTTADPAARTGAVLTAFAGAMLGLVLADDLIVFYIFWELTTVFSYLLVGGHNPGRSANRLAALTALIVTTFGGLAMLVGIVMLGVTAGTFRLSGVLASPVVRAAIDDPATASPIVIIAVLLLLLGALTKSAQVPFHFWLPGAMAAPTPVSAYLHAAAMVKAGVYLVALLSPFFAGLPGWREILLTLGAVTMVLGALRALRQHDIKVLLAYGTVSQLGFLMFMNGLGTRSAMLAGVGMIISHALFKSALFLIVGVVDRSAGSRDIRELSGVGRAMPVVLVASVLAGASMAGVPPLIGFTTKESAFESLSYLVAGSDGTRVPPLPALALTGALLFGSALTVAYTLRFLWGTFATKSAGEDDSPADGRTTACAPRPGGFVAAPLLLAVLSLVGGFLGPQLTAALEPYVALGRVGEPGHGIALWHGFGAPLAMSAAVLVVGGLLFWTRGRVEQMHGSLPRVPEAADVYRLIMRGVDRIAVETTALTQRGSLPNYLGTILVVVIAGPGLVLATTQVFPDRFVIATSAAQVVVGALTIAAAVIAANARGRMKAVVAVGVVGYGAALLFLLHGAPDLALTQVLVETVTLVVLVLVMRKLPRSFTHRPRSSARWWRIAVAGTAGVVVGGIAFYAAGSRTAAPVSETYPTYAYEFGYGDNIVNITLVDIRSWDTLGEIAVLAVAATGVASLIFLRTRNARLTTPDRTRATRRERRRRAAQGPTVWLRGGVALSPANRSVVFEVVTRLLFGVMMVVSIYFLIAGHNDPGGGFAGGLVAGLALAIRYLAGGRDELDEAAPVNAGTVLGSGLLLAGASVLAPALWGGRIGQSYKIDLTIEPLISVATPFGQLPILGEPYLVTSMIFDIGVYLVVVGVMLDLIRSLGSGIDQHEAEDNTPGPRTTGPRAYAASLEGDR
ncbi:multicomponent Na+:H+ antiporter subunit A [Naumannella cuiyingiana]|uniref:Multicomponent Na+:H+ antiporter subunit A n=1 Tax=Naumannella cuiyingiana TaxID=1347891 RepID=A0A7Z0IK87_9ACTN|nr:multicomponent Na+:H+ antiporter subunit A [Naumannella cuiyingiana]